MTSPVCHDPRSVVWWSSWYSLSLFLPSCVNIGTVFLSLSGMIYRTSIPSIHPSISSIIISSPYLLNLRRRRRTGSSSPSDPRQHLPWVSVSKSWCRWRLGRYCCCLGWADDDQDWGIELQDEMEWDGGWRWSLGSLGKSQVRNDSCCGCRWQDKISFTLIVRWFCCYCCLLVYIQAILH